MSAPLNRKRSAGSSKPRHAKHKTDRGGSQKSGLARTAEELRATQQRLMDIIEFLPDATFVIDRDRRVVAWNRAIEEMTGVGKDEVLGRGDEVYSVAFYGERRPILIDFMWGLCPEAEATYQHLERKNHTLTAEAYVPLAYRGRGAHVWVAAAPLLDERGEVVGGIESVRDITDRKRAEQELRASEERYRKGEQELAITLDSLADAVIAADNAGRVVRMNRVAEQQTGWPLEEARQLSLGDVYCTLHPDTRERLVALLAPASWTPGGDDPGGHVLLVARDGIERRIAPNFAQIRDSSGAVRGAVLVFRDVTEQHRMANRLQLAQRMESIGRLAGGIAHDFNNLLCGILAYAEEIKDGTPPETPLRSDAEQILSAAERAAALTRQLLQFSRKQPTQPVLLDLNASVRSMQQLLERLIGEDIELETQLDEAADHVSADPGQLEQVIMNLVLNARDAMPRGGRLTISTGRVDLDAAEARTLLVAPGRFRRLTVADTGLGMTEEVRSRIFEPFFTTKSRERGTGIGLTTVYGIVQQCHGAIRVQSRAGHGTEIHVYLPASTVAPQRPAKVDGRRALRGGTETILVVDDETTVRDMAKRLLRGLGYRVFSAERGSEALEISKQIADRIDLLLTDLVMPQMDGFELAQRMATLRPEARVLFMSGYADGALDDDRVRAEELRFLAKPFTKAQLADKVRDVLDGTAGASTSSHGCPGQP